MTTMAEHDSSPDADLLLKKRARRRLVGAAALALLAVVVLPMVMDREPPPTNPDIQVRIPSQEATGAASRLLSARPAATPLPSPEPGTAVEAKAAPESKGTSVPVASSESKAVAGSALPASPAAVASAPVAPATAKAPVPGAATAAAALPKPAAAERKPADTPAPAAEKPAAPAAAGQGTGQWVVQLGAYKEAGNVKLLLSKLKGMGVPAYTEKFDSPQGPRTRVRAGPFSSQEAAEKARTKIKIVGVDGPVAQK